MATGLLIVAAQRAREQQEEEEKMLGYTEKDLAEGWEFKILRSPAGLFGKPDSLQQALADEGRAGWVLLEKLDDYRIRLKRPVSARASDATRLSDPYATTFGPAVPRAALILMLVGMLTAFLAAAVYFFAVAR